MLRLPVSALRAVDLVVRLIYCAVAPFMLVIMVTLFPIMGVVVNMALALLVFAFAAVVRAYVDRFPLLGKVFGKQLHSRATRLRPCGASRSGRLPAMRVAVMALVSLSLLTPSVARAQHAPLPVELIALDTPEGEKMLAESNAKADFVHLVSSYTTQERPSFCGVASAVTILNALPIPHPAIDVGGLFTQQNVFSESAKTVISSEEVGRGGMTLAQLANFFQAHPAIVQLTYASDTNVDAMREKLSHNLATHGDYVVINYNRGALGQESLGHISPIGAYHAASDRFLLLDVARYKYPPHWVKAAALYDAMNTGDLISGKSRGFLTVSAAKLPPGTKFTANVRRPAMLLAGIIAAALLVGAGLGFLVGRATYKRGPQRNPSLN